MTAYEEPTLDDLLEQQRADEAVRRRDEGAAQAQHGAHPWVRVHLERHLDRLIASGDRFTAETLRARAGDPLASHPNLIGAVILAASKAGRIQTVGYCESTRPEARCRVLRVWQAAPEGVDRDAA